MTIGPSDPTDGATPPPDPPAVPLVTQNAETAAPSADTISRYLDVQHSERTQEPGSKFERTKTTINHGPEPLENSRNTPEGRRLDNQVRAGEFQRTGMDWGHNAATSIGADPGDKVNGSPQNSIQNRSGGTWNQAEGRLRDRLRNDQGSVKTTEIESHFRPGSDTPVYRTMTHTLADGTKVEGNIAYLNNSSPSSRRAAELANEGKTLAPGEGDKLNKPFRDFLKDQKNIDPAELDAKRVQWNQMKADRGIGVESALEAGAEDAGKLGKFVKGAGVVGMAVGAYDLGKAAQESYKEGSIAPVAKEAAKQVGGWAGAAAGAEAGAALGAALGIESGPGALVTGAIGGVVGGIAGSLGVSVSIDAITSLF